MKACFFANIPLEIMNIHVAYKDDINILKDLGLSVSVSNSFRNIDISADVYFAWWASSGVKALIISKIKRKPCLIVAGGSDVSLKDRSPAGYNSRKLLHKLIIKWTLGHADAVLAVSKDIYEDARKLGAKNLHLVYVCVDTKKYKPINVKREHNILIVSHLSKQNVERKKKKISISSMPAVLKKIPDAKLMIVGTKLDGYGELTEFVKSLNLEKSVLFPGKVSEEEKINLYNKSMVFLSPSEHEGFGLVIAEGMACGLPAIVTDRGALPEVVGDAGIYVPLNDVEAIAKAIINIAQNTRLGEYLSRKSVKQANKFSFERRENSIKKIIESLVKKE